MRIQRLRSITFFFLFVNAGVRVIGQSSSNDSQLFSDTSLLEVTLKMNIRKVTADIDERDDHKATISYIEEDGTEVSIKLKIKVRGKTRANSKVCSFPPLRLDFKKGDNEDNIFAGQNKLKLVVHCQESKAYDQYVLHEYLIYKTYNLLSENSLRVRLLKITYQDTKEETKSFSKYAFLIEDIGELAKRNGKVEGGKAINQDRCNQSVLDVLTVFQFMIGNTDWGVAAEHNVKLISNDSTFKSPIPVPYDFDYSGAINTIYAVPSPDIPITSVRDRAFMGYCRQPGTYEKIFEMFNQKKGEIYNLYSEFERLDASRKKMIAKYLDSFYATINNPKKAGRSITKVCKVSHRHVY